MGEKTRFLNCSTEITQKNHHPPFRSEHIDRNSHKFSCSQVPKHRPENGSLVQEKCCQETQSLHGRMADRQNLIFTIGWEYIGGVFRIQREIVC